MKEFLFGWINKTPQEDTPLETVIGFILGLIFFGLFMFAGDIADIIKKHHDNKE